MRIWHQSVAMLENMGGYRALIQRHLDEIARPGVTIDLHGIAPGTYTSMNPRDHVGYLYLQTLNKEQFIRAALQAEAEGYDAFFIATIPDIGYEEIRTLLDIPVVAFGQTSMVFAATLGRTVGVINFNEIADAQVTRNCLTYGLTDLLGPMVNMDFELTDVLAAYEDPTALIERFTEAARRAIDLGAEVLIPGAGPLNLLLADKKVTRIDDVPVIDSLGVGLKFCEMRVDLYQQSGLKPCRRGLYNAQPPRELVDHMRGLYFAEHTAVG
jgi:allantoin racemase